MALPMRTAWIFRFGPPQALISMPPMMPPTPKADWTLPRMRVLSPVRARIMGAKRVKLKLRMKLRERKTERSPTRLGLAKMYLKPKSESSQRLRWPVVSSPVASGRGMWMMRRETMATTKVRMSNTMIPPMPTMVRAIPAAIGATMPEAASARLIIPLALPYCSLGSMVETAAE